MKQKLIYSFADKPACRVGRFSFTPKLHNCINRSQAHVFFSTIQVSNHPDVQTGFVYSTATGYIMHNTRRLVYSYSLIIPCGSYNDKEAIDPFRSPRKIARFGA